MSLASILTKNATDAVKNDIIKNLEKNVEQRKRERDRAQESLDVAYKALDAVRIALGVNANPSPSPSLGEFNRYNGKRFHLDSRSGGRGHFMEVIGGDLLCDCKAKDYNRVCWARKRIENNLRRDDTSWKYPASDWEFRQRIRPRAMYFRIPALDTRRPQVYSPGARFYGTVAES